MVSSSSEVSNLSWEGVLNLGDREPPGLTGASECHEPQGSPTTFIFSVTIDMVTNDVVTLCNHREGAKS